LKIDFNLPISIWRPSWGWLHYSIGISPRSMASIN